MIAPAIKSPKESARTLNGAPGQRRQFPHSSICDELVEIIRKKVSSGELTPGERIFEASLANELGVSRSPLREALLKLSFEGLVRTELHRGTYVTPIDFERLRQLLQFRLLLEDFSVRQIIENNNGRDIQLLQESLDALNAATHVPDPSATIEADLQFHELLVHLGGNEPMYASYKGMLNELRLYIRLTLPYYHSPTDVKNELAEVLTAMRKGRADDASRLIHKHVEFGFKDAEENLS